MKSITAFVLFATVLVGLCMPTNVLGARMIGSMRFLEHKFNNFQSTDPSPAKYGPYIFDQQVDHTKNQSTFKQRYWFNSDNYKQNGPIILYNAGEVEASNFAQWAMTNTSMLSLVNELHGILVVIEHRYYGPSMPVEDYSGKNMYLLTPEQSLADMAYFIQNIKFPNLEYQPAPAPRTPWIIYGGSYSGVLAAWMREKYPTLVFASVSSSGPVQLKENFWEYFDTIHSYGPAHCIQAIESVVTQVDSILFGNDPAKQLELKKTFGLEALEHDDFGVTIAMPMDEWQEHVPGSDPFASFCSIFDHAETPLQYLNVYASYIQSHVVDEYCRNGPIETCFGSHNDNSSRYTDVMFSLRPWTYQTCTQFGYYPSASPKGHPTLLSRFVTAEYYERQCAMFFGKNYIPSQPLTTLNNMNFGGWNVELEHIIWVNGQWDPWRQLSVASPDAPMRKSTDQAPFFIIPQGVHCWDHYSGPYLPEAVKTVQYQIYFILRRWLQQYYTTNGINFTL